MHQRDVVIELPTNMAEALFLLKVTKLHQNDSEELKIFYSRFRDRLYKILCEAYPSEKIKIQTAFAVVLKEKMT